MSELNAELRERLEALIGVDEVVLFMKGVRSAPQCGFSAQTVEILGGYLPRFAVFDVLEDAALREGIKQFSDWPTIPQLYVKGEFVGGADIVAQMHESGELGELLGAPRKVAGTPSVEVSEAAAEQISAAMGDSDADVLRLAIDYRFHNDLSIGPPEEDDVVVESRGVSVHFDRSSAERADGLVIDFVTNAQGTGFKIDNPNAPPVVQEMTVETLAARIRAQDGLRVYDVRTPEEWEQARIEGTRRLDAEAMAELERLDRGTPVAFLCHHGGRSQRAAQVYAAYGFAEVFNVVGGIDAWSQRVDADVPRY